LLPTTKKRKALIFASSLTMGKGNQLQSALLGERKAQESISERKKGPSRLGGEKGRKGFFVLLGKKEKKKRRPRPLNSSDETRKGGEGFTSGSKKKEGKKGRNTDLREEGLRSASKRKGKTRDWVTRRKKGTCGNRGEEKKGKSVLPGEKEGTAVPRYRKKKGKDNLV